MAMSPSRVWIETRGRAAAVAAMGVGGKLGFWRFLKGGSEEMGRASETNCVYIVSERERKLGLT